MPKPIKDEFSDLPVSHQRKTQLRMQRDGRCIICGQPAVGPFLCLKHLIASRERMRKKTGAKKRLKGALSYRLEREMRAARRRRRK
jgi:hypothetical protein